MPDISSDKVCFLIVKARQFESAMEVTDDDEEVEDREISLDDAEAADTVEEIEDPLYQEIAAFIEGLNEDEQIELVALMWVGRGDYTGREWWNAVEEARRARDEHGHTASYLLGVPLLADYLEEGLDVFGLNCEDIEAMHL